jgi:hypothetical protein
MDLISRRWISSHEAIIIEISMKEGEGGKWSTSWSMSPGWSPRRVKPNDFLRRQKIDDLISKTMISSNYNDNQITRRKEKSSRGPDLDEAAEHAEGGMTSGWRLLRRLTWSSDHRKDSLLHSRIMNQHRRQWSWTKIERQANYLTTSERGHRSESRARRRRQCPRKLS